MMKQRNFLENGFLKQFRYSSEGKTVYVSLITGFLRLEYSRNLKTNLLRKVTFVKEDSEDSPALGNVLEFNLSHDKADDRATFIPENGISGIQWVRGRAGWGHTLDIESGDDAGRETDLDTWVDECIDDMINPGR